MQRVMAWLVSVLLCATAAEADDLRLAVPEALETSGFAQFVVPRFSLKTGIRIARVTEDEAADMRFTTSGSPLFSGLGEAWSLTHDGNARAERFLEWLRSDVGKRTIESFKGADGTTFSIAVKKASVEVARDYEGDEALGEKLSLHHCGRCHVINDTNRMNGMGSTPSFAVLRSLSDWDDRFARFFLLNPHPAFTQIEDVSDPFDPSLPPPIVPMEMTQGDLDAILAYVQRIDPADLGAPLQLQ